ncbi:MAG: alkaline phosphatase [Desulfovibrionaceae bacterium]
MLHAHSALRKGLPWLALVLTALFVTFLADAVEAKESTSPQKAKYIFFFIGDGMGIPQRTAAEQFKGVKLAMDTLPAQGITTTYAANRFITGSAAAATALSSGQKTNINYIGMNPKLKPVKTIAEMAKEKGMKVGVVSSVSIDHATPAAFYAHVPHRSQYYDIDVALAESGFDYFGGGGLKDPTNKKGKSKNFKGDARELIKKNGYKVVTDKAEFLALSPEDSGKVFAHNKALPDGDALPYAIDKTDEDISLAEFTAKGIELLDNPSGFFMMVEGGKIDWACHANDAKSAIDDTVAFDQAIQQALAFYRKHPTETLIVVTGDHECGGLTLGFAGTQYESFFQYLDPQDISFQRFTDEPVKLFKETCKKEGGCTFDHIKPAVTHFFGLKFEGDPKKDSLVLEPFQVQMLQEAFQRTMSGETVKSEDPETVLLYGEYDPLTVTITHILNQKAGLGWTSYQHTGVPVSTSAIGVGSVLFNGYYDNTDVAKKIMSTMGVTPTVHYASN